MFVPLPLGKPETKVRISSGPSNDILNFYHTRYSSDYNSPSSNGVLPKRLLHKGTGYASNIRPVVNYNAALDKEENPFMHEVNKSMYNTTTKSDYIKYRPRSVDIFPEKMSGNGDSGYIRDVKSHAVGATEMHKLWHSRSGCDDCPEPVRPLLYKIHNKGNVQQCYGDTEYRVRHTGEQLPSDMTLLDTKVIGCQEPTGHIVNKNIEPITYKPSSTFIGPQQSMNNYTMYQSSYQPFATGNGLEALPNLANRSENNTGNTRENMDTHPPFIPIRPKNFHVPRHLMPGDQSESRYVIPVQGRYKEESGAVLNRKTHYSIDPSLASRQPWLTHYNATHNDPTPKGQDREGHCRGGILKQPEDGFTRSTGLNKFKPDELPASVINTVHPSVARSILADYPAYGYPLYQKPGELQAC